MTPEVTAKLLKESAVLVSLWKGDPLLKKQKVIKEKKVVRWRRRWIMPGYA
jgi:hypothetical protein